MFIREMFTKKYIYEYFNRNKNLIIVSVAIFLVSVILGVVFSENVKPIAMELIKRMLDEFPVETVSENATNLFLNNITANITIIAGGLLFSILSLFAIVINGILIGYVYSVTTPLIFFVGVIPHGIFELTAIILSLTGAFIITKIELKLIQALFAKRLHEELEHSKLYVKDVIFTVIISVVLLVIAAIIEAAVTPVLLLMIM